MVAREYASSEQYRYGFNGKETEDGLANGGYDYGFRIYDSRLARFLSVDPLTRTYPWYTPYQFAGNSPVYNVDMDGREDVPNNYVALSLVYSNGELIFGTGWQHKLSATSSFVVNVSGSNIRSMTLSSYYNYNGLATLGASLQRNNTSYNFKVFGNQDQTVAADPIEITEEGYNTTEDLSQAVYDMGFGDNQTVSTCGSNGAPIVVDPLEVTLSIADDKFKLYSDLSYNVKFSAATTSGTDPAQKVVEAIDEGVQNAQTQSAPLNTPQNIDVSESANSSEEPNYYQRLLDFKEKFLELGEQPTQ